MRTRNWLVVSVVGCALLLSSARAFAAPLMGQTFQLNVSVTGMSVDDSGPTPKIAKQAISTQNIINLALGNNPITAVPSNEVLALVIAPAAGEAALIVLNTSTASNLVTIAGFTVDGVGAKSKGTAVMDGFVLGPIGNGSDGLSGGFLAVSGAVSLNPTNEHVITSFKGSSIIGALQGAAFGNDFDAVINKGKVSTVRELPGMPMPPLD